MAMSERTRENFAAMREDLGKEPFFEEQIRHYMSVSTFRRYKDLMGVRRVTIETQFTMEEILDALNESAMDCTYRSLPYPVSYRDDDEFFMRDGQIWRRNMAYSF